MIHELSSIRRTDCRTGLGSGILVTYSEYMEEGSQAEVKGLKAVRLATGAIELDEPLKVT